MFAGSLPADVTGPDLGSARPAPPNSAAGGAVGAGRRLMSHSPLLLSQQVTHLNQRVQRIETWRLQVV